MIRQVLFEQAPEARQARVERQLLPLVRQRAQERLEQAPGQPLVERPVLRQPQQLRGQPVDSRGSRFGQRSMASCGQQPAERIGFGRSREEVAR